MTTLRSGSATDVGRVRDTNQDCVLDSEALFVVADGMGGHAGGEVASRTAVEALQESFAEDPSAHGLVEAVRQANLAVWQRSHDHTELRGMGTTLTAAALVPASNGDSLALVNVGDSRAYMLRAGELRQLTADHSLVEEMVRNGELTPEQAAFHPKRHILTRALGIEPAVEVDAVEILPSNGDRILLCSDGLVNEVGDGEITGVLTRTGDPGAAARELVSLARAHGGSDNITVVVIEVLDANTTDSVKGPALAAKAGAVPSRQRSTRGNRSGNSATGPAGTTAGRPSDEPTTMVATVERSLTGLGQPEHIGVSVTPPPETAAATSQPAERPPWPAPPRQRRLTARVVAFLAGLLVVLGGAVAIVAWFADSSYYVGLQGSQIVIFHGRPGGFLWFQPRVTQRTSATTSDVLASRIADLRRGTEEPSLSAARTYVSNLVAEARATTGASGITGRGPPAAGP